MSKKSDKIKEEITIKRNSIMELENNIDNLEDDIENLEQKLKKLNYKKDKRSYKAKIKRMPPMELRIKNYTTQLLRNLELNLYGDNK